MTAVPLLEVRNLALNFMSGDETLRAVDGVSFQLAAGDTLGVVGESGCGKSVTALSIMRLVGARGTAQASGEIIFEGSDLARLDEGAMRRIRGDRLAMIYQEPMSALNPTMTVGAQIAEPLLLHRGLSRAAANARVVELLQLVGIPTPELRVHAFPHQLSGGMRQRVMIAMALACEPALLIADEPTTALDVTIQAQILDLLRRLQAEHGMSILLITHDLGVVAETCRRVLVMYAGRVVEEAPVGALFAQPLHPYSEGLIASAPRLDEEHEELTTIEGTVPDLARPLAGCAFAPRCAYALERCHREVPPLELFGDGRRVACFRARERTRA